jgi:16S rRNA (adenine1518-N6/adenine1519-N6)-dimethyltransferase
MLQTRAYAEYVSHVPKSAFYPEPKVDSGIAKISPVSETIMVEDYGIFEGLVRVLFTQRRRKVRGVVSRYLAASYSKQKEEILSRAELDERRVYELTPAEFVNLSNLIVRSVKS